MFLLVIRHARAEDEAEFAQTGRNDDLRPLTEDGIERMRIAAAGLHRIVEEIDVLVSSPLVRARQTADIIAAEYGGLAITELDALRSDAHPRELAEWLKDAAAHETVAVVGHEPNLAELVAWLLTGERDRFVEIKKGAAVMLRLEGTKRGPRSATLLWSLGPRQLHALAGAPNPTAPS